MSAFRSWVRRAASVAILGLAAIGCSEDDDKGGCSADTECDRGAICQDGSCEVLPCSSLGECPGSGRTCLAGVDSCSAKECGGALEGIEQRCAASDTCVESGGHRFSCVDTSALSCAECDEYAVECPACGSADQGIIPVDDDAGVTTDSGPEADAAIAPDSGPVGEAALCSPCAVDADCAALGEGSKCTAISNGAFCSTPCTADGEACPSGFTCLNGVNQCLPASLLCTGCLVDGCDGDAICDPASGECIQPRGACGACTDDTGCEAGLTCAQLGGSRNCLAPCDGDTCNDGHSCAEGVCHPDSGQCDACGGTCAGDTPVCLAAEGRCVECGPGAPCMAPLACGPNNTCEENVSVGCVTEADCRPLGLNVCFGGECVECLGNSDCPPRHACDEQQACVPAPCEGVLCQAGSMCDPQVGRCSPGCNDASDCALPDAMGCNPATGQCFRLDGTCDVGGSESVCAPGAMCSALGLCTCRRDLSDPENPLPPEIIGCQPGLTCLHFALPDSEPPADGICLGGF